MTRAKDISKILTDANISGTLDVSGAFTSQGIDDNANAVAITIDSSERVMIGTTTEGEASGDDLTIATTGTTGITIRSGTSSDGHIFFSDGTSGADEYRGYLQYNHQHNRLVFATDATERMRIDSSGNVGIGTTSVSAKLHVESASSSITPSVHADELLVEGSGNSGITVGSGTSSFGSLRFADSGGDSQGIIGYDHSDNSLKIFTVDAEHLRILSNGALQVKVGASVYDTWSVNSDACQINTNIIDRVSFTVNAANSAFGNDVQRLLCDRGGNSAFDFLCTTSGDLADDQHILRGDGQAYADGSWNGGGADYAEYFEWKDGNTDNEDRRGYTVVLDGHQIRKSTSDDNASTIIGAISGNPSVVGDNAWNSWSSKYQKDDYGSYVLDSDGDRILNSSYDDTKEYVTREDRQEWDIVGLMGKLRIRVGQTIGDRWIKMREISETVHEYLVK